MLPLTAPVSAAFGLVLLAERARGRLAGRARRLAAVADALADVSALATAARIETGRRVTSLDELRRRGRCCSTSRRASSSPWRRRCRLATAARYRRFRYGPGIFKLDWALDGPIPWAAPEVARAGTVHLGGTLDEIVASEAASARGEHPERPFVLLVQATRFDPSRAPAGKHTGWAYCHVPHGSTRDMTARDRGAGRAVRAGLLASSSSRGRR